MNIIIVGAGEVGRHLAESLSSQTHNICIIESSETLAAELNERLDMRILRADGASVAALAEAQSAECDLFFALTTNSHTNLVACSLARATGARKTIARVHSVVQREEWMFDYKTHFGIDHLFSTERLAAVELAKFVRNPNRLMVEEIARGRIELQQTKVSSDSKALQKTLRELAFPARVRIALIQRGEATIIPAAEEVLQPDDLVTLFGEPRKLSEVVSTLDTSAGAAEEVGVVVFGGGEYGFALAQMLEGSRARARIIEKDPSLCKELSSTLQRTVIINGDATSLQQLKEEQVGGADFFIATSRDDEDNVMTCLQAKSLGAKHCLPLVHRADYADVIVRNSQQLGIAGAVSPRVATIRDLMRFVTEDRFHSMMKLHGDAEVLEATVSESSKAAGRKVGEVKWPVGCVLVALVRGTMAVVPAGADSIEKGDTLYAIVSDSSRKTFVKLVTR